ncbi:MAG: alpha/beta hydrolase [Anaerolineae bacterium]|nr:alpha/beta hydrolase [Anaerolineae bacterium]
MVYHFHGETLTLDKAARSSSPGQFVQLSDGFTHYELAGPEGSTPVVLIHGFSVPYFIWDPTFTGLVAAGFRVLRYDLFGRGYSDRPDVVYNQALYERQLLDLVNALDLGTNIDLVGLSMGGAIAVGFTAQHPDRVRRLAMLGPAGFPLPKSLGVRLVRLPHLGEWLFDLLTEKLIVAGLAKDFYVRDKLPEFQEQYRVQMQYRGFRRALLSTLRHGPINTMADAYRRVGQQDRPTLLIWGRYDQTVPFIINEQVRAAIPHIEFHPIENAGHIAHYERPDVVNPMLINFLSRSEKREGK